MEPQISIIVPVYKVPNELLENCINSCAKQKNKSVEVILVDDCSPDSCGEVCDKLAALYDNVRVIHKEKNEGLAAARNTGYFASRGKWITFVDGDDWVEPDMCSILEDYNVSSDVQLVFFAAFRDYNNTSEKLYFAYQNEKKYVGNQCKQLQLDVLDYYKRLSTAYSKFFRRDFLQKHNLIHNEILRMGLEGIDFNVRVFGEVENVISIDKALYHYVYNDESYTAKPNTNRIKMLLLGLHEISKYISTRPNNEDLIRAFENRALRSISDTAVGIFFNPDYKISYTERKEGLNAFLEDPLISQILRKKNGCKASKLQKMILWCEKERFYLGLFVLGTLRKIRMKLK